MTVLRDICMWLKVVYWEVERKEEEESSRNIATIPKCYRK